MVSKVLERITVVLPRSERGRPGLRRLLLGTRAAANLGHLEAVGHKSCRSLVHLGLMERLRRGPNTDVDFVRLDQNPRRVRGIHRA